MEYLISDYYKDIENIGIYETWNKILSHLNNKEDKHGIFNIDTLSDLYELGIANSDKQSKKMLGQYYTPEDVSLLMANWLSNMEGKNVCDVCCGTGNLIIAYLKTIGKEETMNLIKNKQIYLYDIDKIALMICKKM